jgi:monoterpene epsilon-lactone hydrolase
MSSEQLNSILQASAENPPPENPSPQDMRSWWEAVNAQTPIAEGCMIERVDCGPLGGDLIRLAGSDEKRLVVFYHGGGFLFGSARSHRVIASNLARATGAVVLAPDYRLAPEHPAPAAHDDALAIYRWALARGYVPHAISLCGDSAGGNLALATAIAARDAALPLPGALALYSPAVDLANEGETVRTLADAPLLTPALMSLFSTFYVGQSDPKSSTISPLYANLNGLPPVLIHVGSWEILLSDSTRLADRLKAAGVPVELKTWQGMCHDWQLFAPFLDEGMASIEETARFIKTVQS